MKLTIKTIMSVMNNIDVCLDFHNCCNSMHCGYFRWYQFSWINKYEMFDFVILMILISQPLDKLNLGEKDFSILSRLLGKTKLHEHFPTKLFSIVEVNCRFIDIYICLGSILIAFHNKMYISYL